MNLVTDIYSLMGTEKQNKTTNVYKISTKKAFKNALECFKTYLIHTISYRIGTCKWYI